MVVGLEPGMHILAVLSNLSQGLRVGCICTWKALPWHARESGKRIMDFEVKGPTVWGWVLDRPRSQLVALTAQLGFSHQPLGLLPLP